MTNMKTAVNAFVHPRSICDDKAWLYIRHGAYANQALNQILTHDLETAVSLSSTGYEAQDTG